MPSWILKGNQGTSKPIHSLCECIIMGAYYNWMWLLHYKGHQIKLDQEKILGHCIYSSLLGAL